MRIERNGHVSKQICNTYDVNLDLRRYQPWIQRVIQQWEMMQPAKGNLRVETTAFIFSRFPRSCPNCSFPVSKKNIQRLRVADQQPDKPSPPNQKQRSKSKKKTSPAQLSDLHHAL